MSLLAELKARLVPGACVETTFPATTIRGNLSVTVFPGRTIVRKVHRVTPTYAIFEDEKTPGKPGSRLDWPQARCIQNFSPDVFAVSGESSGKPFATYRFL
jgi:hypothetical protein